MLYSSQISSVCLPSLMLPIRNEPVLNSGEWMLLCVYSIQYIQSAYFDCIIITPLVLRWWLIMFPFAAMFLLLKVHKFGLITSRSTHTLPSRRFRWQEALKVASFTSQGFLSFSMTWIGEWRFTVVLEDTQPSELLLEHTAAKFKLLYLRISSQNEYMANHEFFLLQIITHTNSF